MSEAPATDRSRTPSLAAILTVAAYAVLGLILCWSRLVNLGASWASDELMTVRNYVRAGPREILTGHYIPNNHELYSLLGWGTTSLVGESEVALRLWSAVPFVVGAIVVTAWLHVRLGALSGVVFLFFATASPLLLDITRQARGYGLAFLAMSVLTISALEAARSPRAWPIVAFCIAGVVGTWTLPNVGIAFLATGAVLLANRDLRRRAAVGIAISVLVILAWYAPHLDDLLESSQQEYAQPIEPGWVVTAPIDQILVPALRWIDETLLDPNLASLIVVAALALLIGSSPLLRRRHSALVLCAGTVATIVVFWIARTNVAPRFFSFLLVPLLVLLASGIAAILARLTSGRPPILRTVIALTTLGLVALISASQLERVTRLPREAVREAAEAIRVHAPESTPVFAYIPYPRDLEHYLGRPVVALESPAQAQRACRASGEAVFVSQPWILPAVTVPCTGREGARHLRFEQYARGDEINVWLIPSPS